MAEAKTVELAPGVTLTQPKAITMTLEEFIKGRFDRDMDSLTPRTKMFIKRLTDYADGMAPNKPKNVSSITAMQKTYLDTLLGILSSDQMEAVLNWEILLFIASKHSYTVFNERVINQYYNKLPDDKQIVFTLLNTLIVGTADNRVRKAFLRKFQLQAVLDKLPKDIQRDNLAIFYLGATA